jgi:hypothetical protein
MPLEREHSFTAWKWWGRVGGGLLVLIGVLDAVKADHFSLGWPSMTVIVLGALLCFTTLNDLIPRIRKVKFKEMEVVLAEMPLPSNLRDELSGLSAHDIWALDSFARGEIDTSVVNLKPAQRVAARMLVDFKLVSITGEGLDKKVAVTERGIQLLTAARSLPL